MAGLFDILEKIRVKPGMYIGQASVSNLFMFLEGYTTARQELGIELSQEEEEFHGEFQLWLQQQLEIMTSNSWAKMIELQCGSDREAFDYLFELLDEFLQRDKVLDEEQTREEADNVKVG